MKQNKTSAAILTIVLAGCVLMAVVDGVLRPIYPIKSAVKLVLFLLCPLLCGLFLPGLECKSLFRPGKKGWGLPLALAAATYGVILGAYFLLQNLFDFSSISQSLTENVGVTQKNFVWVALYISFANSLLEEFFFRGFAFLQLKKVTSAKFASGCSAIAFALYHVAIINGWFAPGVYLLALAGLTGGALLFNYLDAKYDSIYPSWLIHISANFAINTIGFILFGIL